MGVTFNDIDDEDDFGETHEINVTPFIDVMLVLLIIFMVAAPLSTVDLPVDLPKSSATPQKKPDKPTYVTIKSDLAVAMEKRRSSAWISSARSIRPIPTRSGASSSVATGRVLWRHDGCARAVAGRGLHQGRARGVGGPPGCSRGSQFPPSLGLCNKSARRDSGASRDEQGPLGPAATIAVSMHLGFAALAYVHLQQDAESDDLGAPGIEIDIELTSPRTLTQLPPGPESQESVASPEVAKQVAEVKEADLPKEMPVETENPDRQVTIETNIEPKDESPEVKVKTEASEDSIAQEAMAAPSTGCDRGGEIRHGRSGDRRKPAARAGHLAKGAGRISTGTAVSVGSQPETVRIVLSVDSIGWGGSYPSESSRARVTKLRRGARAMVKRASPVPPPPALVVDEGLSFTLRSTSRRVASGRA